jgi:nucleoside-diphosphate-sugar epimerase
MGLQLALVTGACGFVGTHMVEYLTRKRVRIRATDLPNANHEYIDKLGVEFVPGDLTRKSSLRKVVTSDVDIVFHIASLFDLNASWETLYKVNVIGTKNLCELAVDAGVSRFIHWSSGAIYGKPKQLPTPETAEIAPRNPYERSKAEQEAVVFEYYRRYKLPVTVIRPALIYGLRCRYGIGTLIIAVAKGYLPAIPGTGKTTGTFAHVEDVVNAAWFLTTKHEAVGEVYNIADDTHYTVDEMLPYLAKLLEVEIYRWHIPLWLIRAMTNWLVRRARKKGVRPPFDRDMIEYLTSSYWMDNSKLKALGYKFIHPDVKKSVHDVIAWYKQEGLV